MKKKPSEIHDYISPLSEIHDSSLPILINIKNLTDEKLYDVKLFDYEFEKQEKIAYSCPITTVEYSDILRGLSSENKSEKVIKMIYATAFCDYKKFQNKQITCEFFEQYTSIYGRKISKPHRFLIDPFQQQDAISLIDDLEIKFCNELQIQLAYLMPETEMTFRFYLKK